MKHILVLSILFSLSLALPHTIYQSREIKLHNRNIDTTSHPSLFDASNNRRSTLIHPEQQYIVHFGRPLNTEERKQLESTLSISLDHYLPFNSYVIVADAETINRVSSNVLVKWIGDFAPEYKVPENLLRDIVFHNKNQVIVSLSPKKRTLEEATTLAREWSNSNRIFEAISSSKLIITVSKSEDASNLIEFIAAQPESHYIEARGEYVSHNAYASRVVQTNDRVGTNTPFDTLGLKGDSHIVGLADTGIAYASCYFGGSTATPPTNTLNTALKVVRYNPTNGDTADANGHGTAMAATMAGDNGVHTAPDNNGIAFESKIHFADIQRTGAALTPPADLTTLFSQANTDGARTYVLPFGSNVEWYNSDAQQIDSFSYSNPSFLIITSAGNSASNRSLSSLALAKNALVVGSCQSNVDGLIQGKPALYALNVTENTALFGTHVLSSFSSRGPTPDGRRKPDIVTVGENLYTSNTQACGLTSVSGTSYAAGVAAAASLIARSFFSEGFYPSGVADPSGQFTVNTPSAIIKAVLINSGQPLRLTDSSGNGHYVSLDEYPSSLQGFGRIQLDRVLKTNTYGYPNQALFVYPFPSDNIELVSVGTRETALNCMKATVAGASIKATLVWTDKEASPSAGHILVNDLDLAIVERSGLAHKSKTSDGNFDSHNNVEQVELTNLASGAVVAIHVFGRSVPVGPQTYALVISGQIENVECGPEFLGGDNICPNDCSGAGLCSGALCNCSTGRQGLDCSLTPCPQTTQGTPCGGNGDCNTETGRCTCNRNYALPDCVGTLPPPVVANETTTVTVLPAPKSPYTAGLLAGLVIAAFFLGAIVSIFLGGYLAVRYLEYRREKIRKDRSTKDEEMS